MDFNDGNDPPSDEGSSFVPRLSDWAGLDLGPMPYPLAGNDHAGCLVPPQRLSSELIDVNYCDDTVSLHFLPKAVYTVQAPSFSPCFSQPPGIL